MMPEEVMRLIRMLARATDDGRVKWRSAFDAGIPEPAEEDDFVVSMPEYSINVYQFVNGEEIGFAILGPRGERIYQVSAGPGEDEFNDLQVLFFAAKRKVARIDDILADIDKALEGGQVLGDSDSAEDDIPF